MEHILVRFRCELALDMYRNPEWTFVFKVKLQDSGTPPLTKWYEKNNKQFQQCQSYLKWNYACLDSNTEMSRSSCELLTASAGVFLGQSLAIFTA